MKKRVRGHLFTQFMLCFSAVVILAAGSVFERAEAMKENWNENGGSTVYINRNGSIVRNDWVSTDGETYYMQADGKPVTGIAVINRRTYFFDQAGRLINDGWFSSQRMVSRLVLKPALSVSSRTPGMAREYIFARMDMSSLQYRLSGL